jgi:hypothetical protein
MARHYLFGTGNLYLTPVGGGAPQAFGAIQDVSVSFDGDTKMLYGQNSFPLDTARGKTKITGKASFGQLNPSIYNSVFFGGSIAVGETLQAFNEAASIPATTTYTVTAANGANFKTDLGVFYALSGAPLTQVAAGSEAVGKYSVNQTTGVYTFAVADASKAIVLNYLYGSATTGQTLTINNTLMGSIPTFQLILSNNSKAKQSTLTLLSCTSSKLDLPFKQDDYGIPSLDFSAQDDGTGRVALWSITGG